MTADAVGGVWTYARDLAAGLEARGHDVQIATMGPAPNERPANVHVSTYRLEWEDDPWDDVDRAGGWLLELEEELEPDVVHLNGYAHGSLPWRAPVLVAAHSDVVSWWWAVEGSAPPPRYDLYRAVVEAGLRAAHLVVAPTHAALADLERHYRFRGDRIVIPNGTRFAPDEAVKEPFVLGLGRFWDRAKNVAALERVRGACSWPVLLAGNGTTLGRLDRAGAAALLGRASVFASPVKYEPFGLAILEAALSGCALVLGDLPSLREVWSEAAIFVPPHEDEAIAAGLRLATGDRELRAELAHRARRRALRYSADAMVDRYVTAYERLPVGATA